MARVSSRVLRRLQKLEKRIGYTFKDKALAILALTHSSYRDGKLLIRDNERLEFLGDRILGLLTAQRLYDVADGDEGLMARRLNALVRKETCARIARGINLGEALLLSQSEAKQGGRDKTSILGDACEALLAALYLDGGLTVASGFFDEFWQYEVEKMISVSAKDPKTMLQEKASAYGFGPPAYQVLERFGPDHQPIFVVKVEIEGLGAANGTGNSKKNAECYAATHLLEQWPGKYNT